jgi:predicted ester cyclase
MTVQDFVAEGDRVVVRVICDATHTGTFLGIPATGRRIRFDGAELALFDADGRILREGWHVMDTGAVYRQLGITGGRRDS